MATHIRRYNGLLRVDTTWGLLVDADTYFLSSLEGLKFDKPLATRQCPRQARHGSWKQDVYEKLFELAQLRPVRMAQGSALLIRTDVARALVPEIMRWQTWAEKKQTDHALRPWRRPRDQYGLALARSEMGIYDEEVDWWDASILSLAPEELPSGIIHHLGDKRHQKLLRPGGAKLPDYIHVIEQSKAGKKA